MFQKVQDSYEKCATVPTWLSFIESQNKLNLSFDVYLDEAENKYRDYIDQDSWTYKVSETTVIPKKSRHEPLDDTIAMPAIQKSKANAAHKLSPHSAAARGSKQLPTGVVKKKNKLVKFQQKSHPQKIIQQPVQNHGHQGSPFSTGEA